MPVREHLPQPGQASAGPASPPLARRGGVPRPILVGGLVVLLLGASGAAGVWWWLDRERSADAVVIPVTGQETSVDPDPPADGQSEDPQPDDSRGGGEAEDDSTAWESAIPSSTPTPTRTATALEELQSLRDQDVNSTNLNARWVAQLSSKADGITDESQVAANGTSVFYMDDILAEHLAFRQAPELSGGVLLLTSEDFGKGSTFNGRTIWVTLYDGAFSSADDVQTWCADYRPDLSGAALENVCLPRSLTPPSG